MGISNSYLYDFLPYIFAISDLMMFNVFSSTFFGLCLLFLTFFK